MVHPPTADPGASRSNHEYPSSISVLHSLLIVEDDESHIELIQRAFGAQPECINLTFTRTIKEAKDSISANQPDLAIVDWLLPDGKGVELIDYLAGIGQVPVLMMTSHGNEKLAVEMMKAGALDYIIKSDVTLISMPHIVKNAWLEWNLEYTRKRMAAALDDSEFRYREIFNNVNDAIHIHELSESGEFGKFIEVNDVACRMLRYSPEEFKKLSLPDIYTSSPSRTVEEILREIVTDGNSTFETEHRRKDGTVVPVEVNAHRVVLQGKPVVVSVIRDITERKSAEIELRKSAEKYQTLIESANEGIFVIQDGKIPYANPKALEMIGYPAEILSGKNFLEFVHPDDRDAAFQRHKRRILGEDFESVAKLRVIDKGGTLHYLEINAVLIQWNGRTATLNFITDITKRKNAEEALAESEARVRLSVQSANIGLWDWDINADTVYFSPEWKGQIGYRDEELPNIFDEWQRRLHPDDLEPTLQTLHDYLANPEGRYEDEFRLLHKDGSYRWINSHADTLRDFDGKPVRMLGCHIDVTGRRRVEEELRETNAYLDNLFNYANAPIITWDHEFRITRFNPAFEHLAGRSQEEVLGENLGILFPEESKAFSLALITQTLEGEHWQTVEIPILNANGSTRFVLWNSANVLNREGKVIATIAQGVDITERKRAEEALLQEKNFSDRLFNAPEDTVFLFEPATGKPVRWNKRFSEESGYSDDEIAGMKAPDDFYNEEDLKKANEAMASYLAGNLIVELSLVTKHGASIPFEYSAATIDTTDGRTLLLSIGRNMTERNRVEEQLLIKNYVFDSSLAANSIADNQGLLTSVNPAFLRMWGYLTKEEVIGKSIGSFFADEQDAVRVLDALGTFGRWNGEFTALRAGGSTFITYSVATVIRDDTGKQIGYQSSVIDITERKQVEEALRDSLAEREVLLKEIHHRVKNNLQIVSGLIYLQSKLTKDPETKGMLSACRNRITSMALLHENLFQVSNFSSVSMGPYINNIVNFLADSYDTAEYLAFQVDVPADINLDIDTGIAVGIIITELATNAIKYAFPPGQSGRVEISLHPSGEGMLLGVRDNGIGIPDGFDLASSPGLGMKLVTNLVRQVHGTMDVKGGHGTAISIAFTSGIVTGKRPAPANH